MREIGGPMIVLTDGAADYPPEGMDALARSGVAFLDAEAAGGEPMWWARDADALLVMWFPVTSEVIARLRRCKVIVRIGVGFDNIDTEAARARGIAVCNVPDYCGGEVADHALALALALARALPFLDGCVRRGAWKPALSSPMAAFETMRFGVLGCGRIGRAALERARGFRFELAACDP